MAYDASKDVLVKQIANIPVNDKTRLEIGIYQYNGGAKKVRFARITQGAKGDYRDSIAKMDLAELEEFSARMPEIFNALKG